jgi:hypothetical protein
LLQMLLLPRHHRRRVRQRLQHRLRRRESVTASYSPPYTDDRAVCSCSRAWGGSSRENTTSHCRPLRPINAAFERPPPLPSTHGRLMRSITSSKKFGLVQLWLAGFVHLNRSVHSDRRLFPRTGDKYPISCIEPITPSFRVQGCINFSGFLPDAPTFCATTGGL